MPRISSKIQKTQTRRIGRPKTVTTSVNVNGKTSTIETPNSIRGRKLGRKLAESLDTRPTGLKIVDSVTKGLLSIKGMDAALSQAGLVSEAESVRRITNEWRDLVAKMDKNPKLADAVAKVLSNNYSGPAVDNDNDKTDKPNNGNQIIQI